MFWYLLHWKWHFKCIRAQIRSKIKIETHDKCWHNITQWPYFYHINTYTFTSALNFSIDFKIYQFWCWCRWPWIETNNILAILIWVNTICFAVHNELSFAHNIFNACEKLEQFWHYPNHCCHSYTAKNCSRNGKSSIWIFRKTFGLVQKICDWWN